MLGFEEFCYKAISCKCKTMSYENHEEIHRENSMKKNNNEEIEERERERERERELRLRKYFLDDWENYRIQKLNYNRDTPSYL